MLPHFPTPPSCILHQLAYPARPAPQEIVHLVACKPIPAARICTACSLVRINPPPQPSIHHLPTMQFYIRNDAAEKELLISLLLQRSHATHERSQTPILPRQHHVATSTTHILQGHDAWLHQITLPYLLYTPLPKTSINPHNDTNQISSIPEKKKNTIEDSFSSTYSTLCSHKLMFKNHTQIIHSTKLRLRPWFRNPYNTNTNLNSAL